MHSMCEHVLDCVFEKSFSNPIDRDAALLQLNSSCLVWSRGVQFWLAVGGVVIFMLLPLLLTSDTAIKGFYIILSPLCFSFSSSLYCFIMLL